MSQAIIASDREGEIAENKEDGKKTTKNEAIIENKIKEQSRAEQNMTNITLHDIP